MKFITFCRTQTGFITTTLNNQKTNWIYMLSTWLVPLTFFITVGLILWHWSSLPPLVPLWYSKAWGTDRLAPVIWLFLPPLMSLVWHAINLLLSVYVTREHYVFSQVLFITSIFVTVFSLIAVINILFLVT
jgi:hypothetical protein